MSIPRGTTPTFTLTFPEEVDLTEAAHVYVSFRGGATIEKSDAELTVSAHTVDVVLSQAETLSLAKGIVQIQVNWTYADGSRAASEIASYDFGANLLNRVVE